MVNITELSIDEGDLNLGQSLSEDFQDRESAVAAVASEARTRVIQLIHHASSEKDFIRWNHALIYATTPEMIDWMWEYGGTTAEDLIDDYETSERDAQFIQEQNYLLEMKKKLTQFPSKEGMIKIVIKRIREKHEERTWYRYRVLAEFSSGQYVKPTQYEQPNDRKKEDPHIIYFEPENACVEHPCDDLYKASRDSGGVSYLSVKSYVELLNGVGDGHYMSGRDENDQKLTRDASDYIQFALIGGFTNERRRVRISDFWNRQRNQGQK